MNKKGSLQDVYFIVALFLGIALILIIALFLINKFNDSIAPALNNAQSTTGDPLNHIATFSNNTFNSIYLFVFIGLIITLIISAFLTQIHVIFFPIFFFLLIGAIYLSAMLSNVYEAFKNSSVFTSQISNLPAMDYLLLNLPYVIGIIGMITLIVLFAKGRNTMGGITGAE
jgi:hypothetical protein